MQAFGLSSVSPSLSLGDPGFQTSIIAACGESFAGDRGRSQPKIDAHLASDRFKGLNRNLDRQTQVPIAKRILGKAAAPPCFDGCDLLRFKEPNGLAAKAQ